MRKGLSIYSLQANVVIPHVGRKQTGLTQMIYHVFTITFFFSQDDEFVTTNTENKNLEIFNPLVKHETNVNGNELELIYKISDVPPWYICIFLGLQVSKFLSCIVLIHSRPLLRPSLFPSLNDFQVKTEI